MLHISLVTKKARILMSKKRMRI